ncbi:hypothetical protein YC2023_011201 [Brassica napus]
MGATLPERRHELTVPYLLERPHEVARHFIVLECKNRPSEVSTATPRGQHSDTPRSLGFVSI